MKKSFYQISMTQIHCKANTTMKKLISGQGFIISIFICLMVFVIGIINPAYFSLGTVFDISRSAILVGIFAIAELMVIISGGVDISFASIAVCSMYLSIRFLLNIDYEGTPFLPFLFAGVIGSIFGMINGFFISRFRLPTMIVTLGTSVAFQGLVIFFVGTAHIIDLPGHLLDFSKASLVNSTMPNGSISSLHPAILITFAVAVLGWFILNKTMFGRGIYAIGGSRESAERAGFNIQHLEFSLYSLVGFLAGIGGMTYAVLHRQAEPTMIVGSEMTVIAAVVLGGGSIMGGEGTVGGTLLGVFLIVILSNSLTFLGIPAQWQNVVTGIVILVGTALPIVRARLKKARE